MKILVIQLARLGDIYMSWPMIRALKRKYPNSEIDILVRPRFAAATGGLEEIRKRIELPMKDIFEPLLLAEQDLDKSYETLGNFVDELTEESYDWIINLSFSPVSSYLTHLLSDEKTLVHGYTRHEDGYLNIVDDSAAYFYAQVGPGRPNRIHLADLFTMMVDVDALASDWNPPHIEMYSRELPEKYIVLHVGASEAHKSYSSFGWRSVVEFHLRANPDVPVVLIGANSEKNIADIISSGFDKSSVINLVGETEIADLFPIIKSAEVLIGCDSAPIHIASLTGTATLNISFNSVNFWETGPRAYRSRVLRGANEAEIPSDLIVSEIDALIHRKKALPHTIEYYAGTPAFKGYVDTDEDFEWGLVQALYMGKDFPDPVNTLFVQACQKIAEVNEVLLMQISEIRRHGDIQRIKGVFDRCEDVIRAIAHIVPSVNPLVQWYQTEKTRIGPWGEEEVLNRTEAIHLILKQVTDVYEMLGKKLHHAEIPKESET